MSCGASERNAESLEIVAHITYAFARTHAAVVVVVVAVTVR